MSRRALSRILLMVDDPAALAALRGSLEDPSALALADAKAAEGGRQTCPSDYEIDVVPQGAEGVGRIRQAIWDHRPYALAIIDLRGPAPDEGWQTARQLAQIDSELPLLLVRHGAEAQPAGHPLALPRLVLLSEHPDPTHLRQLVAVQLDRRHAYEELRRTQQELDATQRALEQLREEAEEADQIKRQLLANISHEIRTPMNAILGFTGLVMKGPLPAEQLERLRYVYEAGNTLMTLMEGVLDFSKLAAGKLHLDRSSFRLDAVVRTVLDGFQTVAADKGLSLLCHVDPSTPLRLYGDAGRFREVLASVVGNAVKFTEHGSVQLRIAVDEDGKTAATLRVVVTDTGVGIPLEKQAKVFRSFSQVDGSVTREFGGIGLGLALSKHLLELMGGQIGFRSVPGQGSTFWFTVPFDKDQTFAGQDGGLTPAQPLPALASAPCTASLRSAKEAGGQFRILVADDDRLDRIVLEALLSRTKALVDLVGNGREALVAMEHNAYDLLFLDLGMPDSDGLTAIRRIREAEAGTARHLPIVALTCGSAPDDAGKCLAAGANQHVAKPFSAEVLLEALERWLPGLLEGSRGGESPRAEAAADAAASPQLPNLLNDCVGSLRRALQLPDFRELDSQAQAVKSLVAGSGAGAVADYAMRIQLAARRGDLDRASAAVERLDRAVRRFPGGVRRDAARIPVPFR